MRLKQDQAALERIVEGCREGDNEAFTHLVDMYSKRFYGFFYSHTYDRQASDDLLGEFYLKIVKSIKTYKSGSFEAWMQSVASSVYYDYLRKHIREREKSMEYCREKAYLDDCSTDDEPLEPRDELPQLRLALDALDEESRELVCMRYFSDMSFKDIARATQKPIGTVLAKIHRGVAKLRRNLGVK
jgi:RNA polymerase sigma-70 factor, ECF subfamily